MYVEKAERTEPTGSTEMVPWFQFSRLPEERSETKDKLQKTRSKLVTAELSFACITDVE
jgi:hypothetical protein